MQFFPEPLKINEDEYTLLSENLDEFGITDRDRVASFVMASRRLMLSQLLERAVDEELTSVQRDIIRKLWYDGLSMAEISRQLGVAKSTVTRQTERAYDRLRTALKYVLMYQFENPSDTIQFIKEATKNG